MAFGALYSNGALVVHTTNEGAAVEIGNVTNINILAGLETAAAQSGQLYDYFRSIVSVAAMANVTTESIAQVLGLGLTAKCILADGDHPGVVLYGEEHSECAGRTAGSAHNKYQFRKGLLVPTTLNCAHGQNATISLDIHATKDTTYDSVIPTYDQALPSSVTRNEIFGLGISKVGGQQLDNIQSVNINFGCNVLKRSGSGQLDAIWASPSKYQPVITITTTDPTIVADAKLSIEGTEATHANTKIQFVKRAEYGKYVSAAASEHIYITAAGIIVIDQLHSASGDTEASVTFRIEGVHDGSNVPLICSTAAEYDTTP